MHKPHQRTTRRGFLGTVALGGATLASVGGTASASEGGSTTPSRDVTVYEGLTYADRPETSLELDLYVPASADPTPLVVWIHGGAWLAGNRKASPDLERYFASRGIATATVEYRLSHESAFPSQILDVKAAIRWLRSRANEYNLDGDNVATWGMSAGGHLAAMAGTVADVREIAGDVYDEEDVAKEVATDESGEVQAVVDWYGPTNGLLHDEQHRARLGPPNESPTWLDDGPWSLLVGESPAEPISEHAEKVTAASPITYLDSDAPPFLIMHGLQDQIVPYEQSALLYEVLRDACVDATYYQLDGFPHAFFFEALERKPVPDQTVRSTKECGPGPDERTKHGPPASSKVVEQFLDRHLARGGKRRVSA